MKDSDTILQTCMPNFAGKQVYILIFLKWTNDLQVWTLLSPPKVIVGIL